MNPDVTRPCAAAAVLLAAAAFIAWPAHSQPLEPRSPGTDLPAAGGPAANAVVPGLPGLPGAASVDGYQRGVPDLPGLPGAASADGYQRGVPDLPGLPGAASVDGYQRGVPDLPGLPGAASVDGYQRGVPDLPGLPGAASADDYQRGVPDLPDLPGAAGADDYQRGVPGLPSLPGAAGADDYQRGVPGLPNLPGAAGASDYQRGVPGLPSLPGAAGASDYQRSVPAIPGDPGGNASNDTDPAHAEPSEVQPPDGELPQDATVPGFPGGAVPGASGNPGAPPAAEPGASPAPGTVEPGAPPRAGAADPNAPPVADPDAPPVAGSEDPRTTPIVDPSLPPAADSNAPPADGAGGPGTTRAADPSAPPSAESQDLPEMPRAETPGMMGRPALAPPSRADQILLAVKLKVLQRHYETALSEAMEAEKALLTAPPEARDAVAARQQALRGFAEKLANDIRKLTESPAAAAGAPGTVPGASGSPGAPGTLNRLEIPRFAPAVRGASNRFQNPGSAPGNGVPGAGGPGTAPGEGDASTPGNTRPAGAATDPAEETPPPANGAPLSLARRLQTWVGINSLACSADGTLIAAGGKRDPKRDERSFRASNESPHAVQILDARTGDPVNAWAVMTPEEDTVISNAKGAPEFDVSALAFSPDGDIIAIGTGLGQVKLCNARTGQLLLTLDDEPAKLADKTASALHPLARALGSVTSLAFSPDGGLLAVCGESFEDAARDWGGVDRMGFTTTGPGRLKVWNVKTGALQHDLPGHDRHAEAVSFSPNGKLLASAGGWTGGRGHGTGVIIWDLQTGGQIRVIEVEASGGARAIAFSPDSKLVVIGSLNFNKDDGTSKTSVALAHALTGIVEWKQQFPGGAKPAAFMPDGKSIAVLCAGKSVRLISTDSGAVQHEIQSDLARLGGWSDLAFSAHGRTLVLSGGGRTPGKGGIEIWSLASAAGATTFRTR